MEQQPLVIKKITDEIYHIYEPAMVCSTLVVGKKKALLFDTGYGIWDLNKTIKSITDLPLIVVNSHGHTDHICGNYQFEEVYIHKEDIEVAKIYSGSSIKRLIAKELIHQNLIFPNSFSKEDYIKQNNEVNFIPAKEGHVFELGGIELEVIYLPGHTKGCIALLDEKSRILLGGDSISPHVWMFLEESAEMTTYIDGLINVNKMNFDTVLASHSIEPFNKDIINKLIHCASNIDVSKSKPYSNPVISGKAFIYAEGGEPFVDQDSISIVYAQDKL